MSQVYDLRIGSAYKKQWIDKYHLKEENFLIDPMTNWINFECEFQEGPVKFHPHIRYENKNVTTPRIMDITLYRDSGPFKNVGYKSKYVESGKVSEVSIYNPIEMCKSMYYEMCAIDDNVNRWLEDPNEKRYDLPVMDKKSFYEINCRNGLIDRCGFDKDIMEFDSEEFNLMYDEHKKLVELFNTFPYVVQPGRLDSEEEDSYHLKHILERMDTVRTSNSENPNEYFSNGVTIATMPRALNDRFQNMVRTKNESVPNCDIVLPKQMYYFLECVDSMIRGELK